MPGGKGACCNVTVSLYVYCDFEKNSSSTLTIEHLASGKTESLSLPFKDHPKTLAEAAAKALHLTDNDGGLIRVESDVPPGSGVGGSASYSVALLAALNPSLLEDKHRLAGLAQELETKWLGNSCGTQDQTAAAFGFISSSAIEYPQFTHEKVAISPAMKDQIEACLLLVYTGQSHFSSEMHHTVIRELEAGNVQVVQAFHDLKTCGEEAAERLVADDFDGYKQVLNKNWEAQKALHPEITTHAIESLYAFIRELDPALAFKGSGAGGGGSIGVLVDPTKKKEIAHAIESHFPMMMVWDSLTIDPDGARTL